ncbi:MAG: hypothetical protein KDJ36_15910 [Hyphomicrobiaceae bacterium]|nr:hypothetical protein [Hyphomicrobiaceae bacterium]
MPERTSADRITFLPDDQVMEADFSDKTFEVSGQVNDFYDELDRRIEASGEKWFFLVNYRNSTIMPEAWITFAHRGKKSNLAYSLGSVRFGADAATGKAILARSTVERFDPNLFPSRDAALAHLRKLRADISPNQFAGLKKLDEAATVRGPEGRILFHPELEIMEVDFSDLTFERASDVNGFYDVIDRKIAETGRKWYFLVNYMNCTILPDAWIAFASRGKQSNLNSSLGSVRFDATKATSDSILGHAREASFDPNLFSSRDDAIRRIVELRGAA